MSLTSNMYKLRLIKVKTMSLIIVFYLYCEGRLLWICSLLLLWRCNNKNISCSLHWMLSIHLFHCYCLPLLLYTFPSNIYTVFNAFSCFLKCPHYYSYKNMFFLYSSISVILFWVYIRMDTSQLLLLCYLTGWKDLFHLWCY